MSDDFMELGDSGLVPVGNGWFLNKNTNERIAPDGKIYNEDGKVIYEPELSEDEEYDR